VSSREATNTIVLCFKEGLHTINTLAVRPTSTSEIVLAAILLEERFDARPKIVPIMSAFDEALRTADAVLLVGNEAVEQASHYRNTLDLVEEWSDMTNLPYVHGFWCVREENVSKNDVAVIQQACKRGMESIDDIVHAEIAKRDLQIPPNVLRQYFERFSFTFTEEEQDALTEFLRYAYYHGILPDVADLNFYPTMDTEDDLPLLDPSLN
jgi:chorismate dehydratase